MSRTTESQDQVAIIAHAAERQIPEHSTIWPENILQQRPVKFTEPTHSGEAGFLELRDHLYDIADNKHFLAGLRGQVNVLQGEIGWYISARGNFHLLGRGAQRPQAWHSRAQKTDLNAPEIHLPAGVANRRSQFHIVKVEPGQLIPYTRNGVTGFLKAGIDNEGTEVPGYHLIENDQTFSVSARIDLTQPRLLAHSGPNWIIKVPPGQLCKAHVGDKPIFLSEGIHTFNNANFQVDGADPFVSTNERHIKHGPLHVIRLRQGELMAVRDGSQFHLLGASQLLSDEELESSQIDMPHHMDANNKLWYTINSPNFEVLTEAIGESQRPLIYKSTDPLIVSGPAVIMQIPRGMLARIWDKGKSVFVQSSDKPIFFNDTTKRLASEQDPNPAYRYPPLVNEGDSFIRHGTECRVRVPDGQVYLANRGERALMLGARKLMQGQKGDNIEDLLNAVDPEELYNSEHNQYEINDPSFRLLDEQPGSLAHVHAVGEADINHGNVTILNVKENELAVVRDSVESTTYTLPAGKHMIASPKQVLLGKQPVAETIHPLTLEELSAQTADSHQLTVNASVSYSIEHPELAVMQHDLPATLRQQCQAVLNNCIRSTMLENMGSGNITDSLEKRGGGSSEPQSADEQGAKDKFNLVFLTEKKRLEATLKEMGVRLNGFDLQHWNPVNQTVRDGLEQASLATLEAHRHVATAMASGRKATAEAEAKLAQDKLAAQAEAAKVIAAAEAKKEAAIKAAEAEQCKLEMEAATRGKIAEINASSQIREARAKAEAIALISKAEADATSLKMKAVAKKPAEQWALERTDAYAKSVRGMMKGAHITVTSAAEVARVAQLACLSGGARSGLTLFAPAEQDRIKASNHGLADTDLATQHGSLQRRLTS